MIRANNSLQYRIELRGFSAAVMYGFGGSETQRNERSTSPTSGDDLYGANLQYNATNWGVGVGYNHNYVVPFNTSPGPGVRSAQKHSGLEMFNAGGFIGFGPVKLYAQYVKRDNDNPILQPADIQNLVVTGARPLRSWRPSDQQLRHGHDARPGRPDRLGRLPRRHFLALRQQHAVRRLQLRQGRWTLGLGHGRRQGQPLWRCVLL